MRLLVLMIACALASCSSSALGGSGGSAPAKTYIVLPNGQVEPAPTQPAQ